MAGLRERLYISTVDENAAALARSYDLGLELADFCTALNLDQPERSKREAAMADRMSGLSRFVLHAPFCELTPCAVDPMIGEVSRFRYEQAAELALAHGVKRLVIHSGFVPNVYYPGWYMEQAPRFWREYLATKPADFELLLENVLDPEPGILAQTAAAVGDPRLGLCLDIGHATVYSERSWQEWTEAFAPYLRHVHLHDNDGAADLHLPLGTGALPLKPWLEALEQARPTYTLESMDAAPSLRLLERQGLL